MYLSERTLVARSRSCRIISIVNFLIVVLSIGLHVVTAILFVLSVLPWTTFFWRSENSMLHIILWQHVCIGSSFFLTNIDDFLVRNFMQHLIEVVDKIPKLVVPIDTVGELLLPQRTVGSVSLSNFQLSFLSIIISLPYYNDSVYLGRRHHTICYLHQKTLSRHRTG